MEASFLNCFLFFIIMISNSTFAQVHDHRNICTESRCGKNEPLIRFPFRLKDSHSHQPNNTCNYPGFDLICIEKKTALELPNSNNNPIFVRKIDYKSQEIQVHSRSSCLISLLLSELSNGSLNPNFRFKHRSSDTKPSYTVLRCSRRDEPCRTVVVRSDSEVQASHNDVVSCTKASDFESVPDEIFRLLWKGYRGSNIGLTWLRPDCRLCEAKGQGCRLKKLVGEETECFQRIKAKSKSSLVILRTTTIAASSLIFLLLVIIAAATFVRISKRNEKESHKQRIEKFLDDYNALKPSRYLYADIKKITNQFEEVIGEGSYGTVFKGKLSNEILVAVKILKDSKKPNAGDEFINEVAAMTRIHHVNVIRLVGYCAEGFIRALVFELLPNGSLEKYVALAGAKPSLGVEALYGIALGVARGIEYLHQGCDKRILHFDIKARNVLLDEDFVPKISHFSLAKIAPVDDSYKSDVYSFGILLLEMVGGQKETNPQEIYYDPEWINNLRIIVGEESEAKMVKKMAIIGLWCIERNPMERPDMKSVVQMLEGGDNELLAIIPPNPFGSVRGSDSDTNKSSTGYGVRA